MTENKDWFDYISRKVNSLDIPYGTLIEIVAPNKCKFVKHNSSHNEEPIDHLVSGKYCGQSLVDKNLSIIELTEVGNSGYQLPCVQLFETKNLKPKGYKDWLKLRLSAISYIKSIAFAHTGQQLDEVPEWMVHALISWRN